MARSELRLGVAEPCEVRVPDAIGRVGPQSVALPADAEVQDRRRLDLLAVDEELSLLAVAARTVGFGTQSGAIGAAGRHDGRVGRSSARRNSVSKRSAQPAPKCSSNTASRGSASSQNPKITEWVATSACSATRRRASRAWRWRASHVAGVVRSSV